jgi:DNA-binding transcriptional ArsR family regulator
MDLLLHPVRLRILQEFFGRARLTTGDLASRLSDVPPASLYRQVAKLVDGGVLAVVDERRVRGTVERVYEFRQDRALAGADDLAAMSADDHRDAFLGFVAGLMASFDRYLAAAGDGVDLRRDGVTYSMSAAWLDDAEFARLLADIAALLAPAYLNTPRAGRSRRLLASALMPMADPVIDGDGEPR